MNATQELRLELARHNERKALILSRLDAEIRALPDNPRIKRLSARAFLMRASDLRSNWSPRYHDFKWCYSEIAKAVARSPDPDNMLNGIIESGKLKIYRGVSSWDVVSLHPDVIEKLNGAEGRRKGRDNQLINYPRRSGDIF